MTDIFQGAASKIQDYAGYMWTCCHDDHDYNTFDPVIGVWRVWFMRSAGQVNGCKLGVSSAKLVVIGVRPGECWKLENESLGCIFLQPGRLTSLGSEIIFCWWSIDVRQRQEARKREQKTSDTKEP